MSPEIYSEWLRRQGQSVVRTESAYWHSEGLGIYQAFPYHRLIEPDKNELWELFSRHGARGLRYSMPQESARGCPSYAIVFEGGEYSFEMMGHRTRKNIRKGLRECCVEPITFPVLVDEAWDLRLDAFDRQGRNRFISRDAWRKRYLHAVDLPGFQAWGARVGDRLAGYVVTFQMEDCLCILDHQSHRQHLDLNVNNALTFVVSQHGVSLPGVRTLFYGLESLDAPERVPDVNPDREGHNSACATQSPDAARIPNEAAPPSLPSTPADPGGAYLPAPGKMGALLVERGHIKPEELAMALREQDQGDRRRIGEILVTLGVCKPEDVLAAQQFLESRVRETSVETVRVGVNLLDELMNLVGELVLARNQLLQFSRNTKEKRFQNISQRVNLIATKLQDEVMKTRMQQIGSVWNKFPRTVRDLALSCGKEVRLELEGQDTELDRTIIEAIKDPLTHLVRNAIDHGIESPETRKQTGKNPSGVLRLSAFHESGQVNIEIHDDGAGLNGERIRRKAIERGLISQQQASRMIDRDAFNLIFQPGFSTAEKVTNVSGRGVGMDVVKTNVEKIGGTIDIQSVPGQGTTVCVKIPLTLAIIPALMVRCGAERFAIPQVGLTELVRLEGGKGVEWVRGLPVYRLRGRLLPLVSLDQVLRLGSQNVAVSLGMTDPVEGRMDSKTVNLVVLEAAGRQFGLIVNDILNTEEIVVKPLGKLLRGLSAYGGATILGDGTVALILDAKGLAGLAGISTEERASTSEKSTPPSVEQKIGSTDWERLLLAESEAGARFAIPLCQVSHLERFPIAVIQRVGAREVADYGGQILPLLRLSSLFPGGDEVADQHRPSIHVVVCSKGGRTTGLIVGRIVDIVDQTAKLESVDQRRGVMGTCMIDRKMTDVLDVPAIIEESFPAISALSQLSSQSGQGIADMEKIGI